MWHRPTKLAIRTIVVLNNKFSSIDDIFSKDYFFAPFQLIHLVLLLPLLSSLPLHFDHLILKELLERKENSLHQIVANQLFDI